MTSFLFLFLMALTPALAQDDAVAPEVVEEAAAPVAAEEVVAEEAAAPEAAEEAPAAEAVEGEDAPDLVVDVPVSDEEAIADMKEAVASVQNGQWATFLFLLLGILAYGWNRWTASKAASEDAPTEG
jgi:hypothetical protein